MMWAPKHCKVSHICKKNSKPLKKGPFTWALQIWPFLSFLNGFISRQNKLLTWNQPHMDTNIPNFNNKERAFRYLQPFQICFKLKHWTWHCQNYLHFFICILGPGCLSMYNSGLSFWFRSWGKNKSTLSPGILLRSWESLDFARSAENSTFKRAFFIISTTSK